MLDKQPFVPNFSGTRLRIGVAFSVLALLLFGLTGVLSGERARELSQRDSGAALAQLAGRTGQALERGVIERFREIRNVAQLEELLGTAIDPSGWRAIADRMKSSYPHYAWIGVADGDGRVLAATDGLLEGRNVSQRPWFSRGRAAPFVGDVHDALLLASLLPPTADGEPLRLIDFSAPLPHPGGATRVLGAHLRWDWAEERRRETLRLVDPERGVEIVVVGPQGQVLLGPPHPPPASAADAAQVLQTLAQGPAMLTWQDGKRYLSAAAPAIRDAGLGLPWTVLVRQPADLALAAATRVQRQIWALGAAGALLFGVLAWWLSGRLTAPLRALAQQAQRITTAVVPEAPAARDEVEQLAASLGMLLSQLQQRERELLQLNESLESRVQQRTATLAQVNDDLQSFSRSVSHDLKGPIGSIGMVLRNVLDTRGGQLDASGQRMLRAVADECDRLRELIDELLTLAMVEQRELSHDPVSTEALVQAVLDELQPAGAGRAQVVLGDLPAVQGDAVLLRQVWHNLLANAVKFSAKAERPQIEVAVETVAGEQGREWQFCVSDNGAGFDASQTGRLFGVFQRLHRASDYPGTGVGLSIVKRVVHRHGGRVWARSEPGGGARFYFTLPQSARPGNGLSST